MHFVHSIGSSSDVEQEIQPKLKCSQLMHLDLSVLKAKKSWHSEQSSGSSLSISLQFGIFGTWHLPSLRT